MSNLLDFIREIKDLPLDMKNKLIEMRAKQMEIDHMQAKLALEKNKENISEIKSEKGNKEIEGDNKGTYANLNNNEQEEICGVCHTPIVNPIFLNCLHKFCSKCVDSFSEHNVTNCPMCRHPIEIERKINMIFQECSRDIGKHEIDIFNCTLQWYAVDVYIEHVYPWVKIGLTNKEKKDMDKVINKCNNYLTTIGVTEIKKVYFYERNQGTKQFINVFNRTKFHRQGIYKADITLTIHSIKCRTFRSSSHLRIYLDEIHIKGGTPPSPKKSCLIS